MKVEIAVSVAFVVSGLPFCLAWGDMGHQTVAYIASNFGRIYLSSSLPQAFLDCILNSFVVTTPTKTHFQKILGDTTTDYLAAVATYVNSPPQKHKIILTKSKADTYRYTSAGLYSKPFHFIDAHDSPPSSCGVDYSRDCGKGGCIVSAIRNYVSIT